jgi:hypothetical protein
VANVHLAELEIETGQRDAAIRRLSWLAERTDDPEAAGKVGELLQAEGENREEGAGYVERARTRYEVLLARHREAFLDHAAEFFAGPGGDPRRGAGLAAENLALRQTGRAHALAIETALAAGDLAATCRRAREAASVAARHPVLRSVATEASRRCE